MPCTVTGSLEGDRALAHSEAQEEATKVTQLLCKLCKIVENSDGLILPRDVSKWWESHKKIDAQERKMHARDKALAKLTEEDKRALNLA